MSEWWRNADGDELRVDQRKDGWVYFVSWRSWQQVGSPRRMPESLFVDAVADAKMEQEAEGE